MSEEAASSSSSVVSGSGGDGLLSQDGSVNHSPVKAKAAKKAKLKPKPLREVLQKVLPQLQRRDLYQFFTQPVPADEVPEYYNIIQRPMDFSTMEMKLDQGAYQSLESFRVSVASKTDIKAY